MHLDVRQQEQLFAVLTKYKVLFDGLLGTWKEHPHDIDLKPDSKPYHAKAFPIPKIHLETLKAEVQPSVTWEYYKRLTVRNGRHPHSSFLRRMGVYDSSQISKN
jgi:hypothetical protein